MANWQRWIQTLILGLTGLYFAYTIASGNITFYIARKFVWLTWFAAGLFVLLAGMQAASLLRARGKPHDHDHTHDHHHHDHHHHTSGIGGWVGLVIVAAPVVFGVLVPARPLDSRAIEGEIAGSLGSVQIASDDVIGIAPQERSVLDWLRAFNVAEDLSQFNGQEAEVTGFVYRDARFDRAAQFMVARFVISCCVADAQAIGVVIESPQAGEFKDDTWVRVRGTFEVKLFDGARYPVLVAYAGPEGIARVDQPDHPYLYP